ncbi:hypothetical protein GCM10011506_36090 [Marivirga lumbricoides]|uniref:Uncharacterized protein n=1 Tax=Marivirga lumbricoides TaxID=1046115 RepID=A0A2T4DQZ4_9BACT|nr:hypothetical protein C9994_08330 [Marivirga lumbricoides]GGC47310.1 hypothetical protein GCM10011506_36090 [Marivirga lumbricoides]
MARKYEVKYIKLLLDELGKTTGYSIDHFGFGRMSDEIFEKLNVSISAKYIYYSLHNAVKKATNENDLLNLSPNKVDDLAKFLEYENFDAFIRAFESPIHSILLSLVGDYYSYVRKNTERGILLQSPVQINVLNNKVIFKLTGPRWKYEGEMRYQDGCLFCLMQAESAKTFHHVYKIGKSESPQVLMGVFSGVSSANDPIGGRCVLIRKGIIPEGISPLKMTIEELVSSSDDNLKKLGNYFKNYADNNLKINTASGFDIDDL